jgi:hypothetical protein
MNNGAGGLQGGFIRAIDSGGWEEFLQEMIKGSAL